MESITEIAQACLESFRQLTAALIEASAENRESMPPDKLEWEFGRFKIWCGNLGALQSGKSSLDSRLRESTVMRTNVSKHLTRLDQTLVKSIEVTSGARLPFEKQPKPEDSSDESSSEESGNDEESPKELVLHMVTIKEILSDLYMLSFRIRNNSTRPTSDLRIKLYSDVDNETGIDKFAAYTEFDKRHIEDSLLQLRRDAAKEMKRKSSEVAQIIDADQYLIDRLVVTMNKRRKVLRYWQRHAKKMAQMPKEVKVAMKPRLMPKFHAAKIETQSVIEKPSKQVQFIVPSVTEETMLSKTEATRYDKRLDDVLEVQSIISYTSITGDVHGDDVDLPAPPTAASRGSEFLCPYCGIVCPARHGQYHAWRAHILQDLQPYICTYEKCEDGDHLFSSRTAWLEHERLGHRRVWLCFEHAEPKFWSKVALQNHLESEHGNNLTETQIQDLVEVSELSVEDTRPTCPFCLLEGPFPKGFENHMAFHMRAFAAFSVSRDISTHGEDDVDANENQSGRAQGLGSQDSRISGPLQFDSRPPSNAASDAGIPAFQSPPSSICYEQSLSEDEPDEPPAVPLERSPVQNQTKQQQQRSSLPLKKTEANAQGRDSDNALQAASEGDHESFDPHGSIRKPPSSVIPTEMTISPPESSHNSSDDEEPLARGRSRDPEAENLKLLYAAISSIEQRKSSSPDRRIDGLPGEQDQTGLVVQVDGPTQLQFSESSRPLLSQEARKISHSRSSTGSSIGFEPPEVQTPLVQITQDTDDSDGDSDGYLADRLPIVRKKDGKLVRPALRPSSRRRPSSMPGTPTYSKAVHFDSHLEHVRHFLQVDRPLAVSTGTSPVENYESEGEFPFGSDETHTGPRPAPYEWEIRLVNFPPDSEARRALPVFVERVSMSSDGESLIGTVAVQNLAFHKSVSARFTLNYWKTASEVAAEYNPDVRQKHEDGLNRFNFSIRLTDQANLETKTLFFCVRYNINDQQFWDNNNSLNYQVDFVKKAKPRHGKSEMPELDARSISILPRSRASPSTSSAKPKSMPISFSDFTGNRAEGKPLEFGSRYDFNLSLTAAKNNALRERSGLSSGTDTKQFSYEVPATTPPFPPVTPKPAALVSQYKPPLTSQSYQELVDKYCFVGAREKSEEVKTD